MLRSGLLRTGKLRSAFVNHDHRNLFEHETSRLISGYGIRNLLKIAYQEAFVEYPDIKI
jgi:hypothetical protein